MVGRDAMAVRTDECTAVAALWIAPAADRAKRSAARVPPASGTVLNEFSGQAGTAFQAGAVYGDIHIADGTGTADPDDTPWLRALWRLAAPAHARVELRYLTEPRTRQVTGVLIIRTPGPYPDAVIDLADRLRAAAPAQVRTRPITSDCDLRHVLEPFHPDPHGILEIRKRITAQRSTRGDTRNLWLSTVTPWRRSNRCWSPLWTELAAQPYQLMLSVGLIPFRIGLGLRENLKAHANELDRLAKPGPSATYSVFGAKRPPDQFAALAAPLAVNAIRRYTDQAFQIRVSLAADRPISDVLAHRLAEAISPGVPGDGFLGAPATVVRPHPHEYAVAWQNITGLNFDPLPIAHQQGLPPGALGDLERTLGAIADIDEAAAAFRLPHTPVFRPIPG